MSSACSEIIKKHDDIIDTVDIAKLMSGKCREDFLKFIDTQTDLDFYISCYNRCSNTLRCMYTHEDNKICQTCGNVSHAFVCFHCKKHKLEPYDYKKYYGYGFCKGTTSICNTCMSTSSNNLEISLQVLASTNTLYDVNSKLITICMDIIVKYISSTLNIKHIEHVGLTEFLVIYNFDLEKRRNIRLINNLESLENIKESYKILQRIPNINGSLNYASIHDNMFLIEII